MIGLPRFTPEPKKSSLRIVVGRHGQAAPGPTGGRVLEEDTFLVLSADPEAKEVRQRPRAILREIDDTFPKKPGSVLIRDNVHPVELLAIVHDLDRDPSWREEWVTAALGKILREAYDRDLWSLAVPAFGSKHPSLSLRRFAELFRDAIEKAGAGAPDYVWLELPAGVDVSPLKPLEPWIA